MESNKKDQRHRDSEHLLMVAHEKKGKISQASIRRAHRVTAERSQAALRRFLSQTDPSQESSG